MRIKRGSNSMRVRRRQSDAKWRASVASCYDTLKFVIPDNGILPKRKVSKAVILQRTDKHIRELEKGVSTLLIQEAERLNKSVFWKVGKQWTPATLSHIRKEFEEKQAHLFQHATQGRRRYSMLADIEEEILKMTVDPGHFTVVAKGSSLEAQQINRGKQQITVSCRAKILRKELTRPCPATTASVHKRMRQNSHQTTRQSDASVICERLPQSELLQVPSFDSDCKYSLLRDGPVASLLTPTKPSYVNDCDNLFSPIGDCQEFTTPLYTGSRRADTKPPLTSPHLSKVAKQLNFFNEEDDFELTRPDFPHGNKLSSNLFGFTPVKLPSEDDLGFTPIKPLLPPTEEKQDIQLSPAITPGSRRTTYPPQTIQTNTNGNESDEETKNLLCMETFDMESDDRPEWERYDASKTPEKIQTCEKFSKKICRKELCKKKIGFHGFAADRVRKIRDHVPKCRKNLEKLYIGADDKNELPIIAGVFDKDEHFSDFDGYFLFYRQVVDELQQHMSREEIASPSVATIVSQMWSDMSTVDKETLATLAALEGSQDSNSSSGLSEDLQELDVKPLDSHFLDAGKIDRLKAGLQTVPSLNSDALTATINKVLHISSDTLDNQEVPGSCHNRSFDGHGIGQHSESGGDMTIVNLGFDSTLSELQDFDDVTSQCNVGLSVCTDFSDVENCQIVPDVSSVVKRDVLLSSTQSTKPIFSYR